MLKKLKQQFKNKSINDKITYLFIGVSTFFILCFAAQTIFYYFSFKFNHFLNNPLFLQAPGDTFMDFFNVNLFVINNDPYLSEGSSYPPLVLFIAKFFALFTKRGFAGEVVGLLLFFLLSFVPMALLFIKYLKDKKFCIKTIILLIAVFFFFTPMLFLIQRGNYLLFAFLFTAVFFVFRNSKNKILKELSYISLAFAVGIKIYPAVFAVVLLKEKKLFALSRTALYSAILLIVPFAFFKGGFANIPVFFENLSDFTSGEIVHIFDGEIRVMLPSNNYSVVNTVYIFLKLIFRVEYLSRPEWVSVVQTIIMAFFALAILFSIFLSDKQWKVLAACSLAIILLPNPSFVYTAVFLFIPCAAFLTDKSKTKKDWAYMTLFLLIFSPVQFGYFNSQWEKDIRFGLTVANFVQAVTLLAFVIMLTADAAKNLSGKIKAKKQNTAVGLKSASN